MDKFFHWDVDNKKLNFGTTVACFVAGLAALVYLLAVIIGNGFDGNQTVRYNFYFAFLFIVATVPTGYMLYHMTKKKEFKYEKLFLVLAFSWCIVFQLAMPPLSGPDEDEHFISAYNASDVFMGLDNHDESSFWMRGIDAQFWNFDVYFPGDYNLIANGEWFGVTDEEAELFIAGLRSVRWYRYIPSGLGIALARLLRFNTVALLLCGRFFNSLFFILCGYLAVKFTPVGKAQMCAVAMIPMLMELVSTYSYDTISISTTILFTALCLYFGEENSRFTLLELFILGFVLLLLIPNKGVYIPFMIMLLAIPFRQWKHLLLHRKWISVAEVAALLVVGGIVFKRYLLIFFQSYMWRFTAGGRHIDQDETRMAYSTYEIFTYKDNTRRMIWHTFSTYGWTDFMNLLGRNPLHHTMGIILPSVLFVIITIAILANLVFNRKEGLNKARYIIWIVTSIAVLVVIVLGCFVRFTPLDAERIQIASRYYIPIFVCGILCTGSRAEENQWALKILFVQNVCMIVYVGIILKILLNWI